MEMHTHAGSAFDNRVSLFLDLLTSGSLHAERLPCIVCLPRLVLIARAVFLLECGHTDKRHTHTRSQTHRWSPYTLCSAIAGMGNSVWRRRWDPDVAGVTSWSRGCWRWQDVGFTVEGARRRRRRTAPLWPAAAAASGQAWSRAPARPSPVAADIDRQKGAAPRRSARRTSASCVDVGHTPARRHTDDDSDDLLADAPTIHRSVLKLRACRQPADTISYYKERRSLWDRGDMSPNILEVISFRMSTRVTATVCCILTQILCVVSQTASAPGPRLGHQTPSLLLCPAQ